MVENSAAPSLEDLLARVALADQSAFADLYDATSATLFGHLLRMLKQRDRAEDALQEVFLKVWRKAGEYHHAKGAVMTWLISIARYHAIDLMRKGKTSPDASNKDGDLIDSLASKEPGGYQQLLRASNQALLADCLDQLEDNPCSCVVLAYREGYSYQQLSSLLGSPMGTIKSWISRGLKSLRKCLEHGDD